MASRQEEKERRRAERLAAEAADNAAKSRTRRLQLALGALLAVAVVVVAVIAITGSGDDSDSASGNGGPSASSTGVAIPAASNRDLAAAAKAAGCTVRSPPIEGSTHVTTTVTYKTNPPTSGNHNPEAALDGIYAPGNSPQVEKSVHTLEHGRIEIQYKPGTSAHRIAQLTTLANEPLFGKNAYKVLLFENTTNMPYAVAATAWGQMITCETFNTKIFDAIRDFRVKYVDKAPETFPPNN
jgi:hypothetical protein